MIETGGITADNIASNAIEHAKMADNSVGNDEMRNDAVNTNEIVDGAVTAGKLASTLNLSGKTLTLSAAQRASDYILIRDEKAAGTEGGTFTSGAWQTRTLNTEVSDAGGHASLATNQITLAAGTYECRISCPGSIVADHQARLYNTTAAATILEGTSEQSAAGSTTTSRSVIVGRFTVAAAQALEVQHRCSTTRATDGFGGAANFGEKEVYTIAEFWRVA